MDKIVQNIKENPALVVALVSTLSACLMAFGLPLTAEQVGAVVALTNAVLALVLGKPVQAVRKARARHDA